MRKSIVTVTVLATMLLLTVSTSFAQIGLGADVVSRYVWRGTDFGNALSIQPAMAFTKGSLEIGAWASYPVDNGSVGSNENDLYITYSVGDLGLTLTDYYFPEAGGVFKYKDEDAFHFLEASASYGIGSLSLLGGYFFSGDEDNSMYFELGYALGTFENVEASLVVGGGDGMYVTDESGDFNVVNIGITFAKDALSASYIINPEAETNFLVFGYSF